MTEPFHVIEPSVKKVPFVLSIPHCGTKFPNDLIDSFDPQLVSVLDDTDWYLEELYDFASQLGITVVFAEYSRWVIDLNRDPHRIPLYDDSRITTGLTPLIDFKGNPIYKDETLHPDEGEVDKRLKDYYWPYYSKIQSLLDEFIETYGKAFFWDAHSIRHFVPTISPKKFPDFVIGSNDITTAHPSLIETVLMSLNKNNFQVAHNDPFKGGHLTRFFGDPDNDIHALQLEMTKILYMDDDELKYDQVKASQIKSILKDIFVQLIATLKNI